MERVVRRAEKAGNWYPGGDSPDYLDGSIPGDYGFDPFGLGKDKGNLMRFREAELLHGRWAMLGALGCLVVEATGQGNWLQAPQWAIDGTAATYLGNSIPFPLPVVVGIQIFVMSYLEQKRTDQTDPVKRLYPGGAFDPAGFSKGADFEKLKRKEIANGRLAMVAFAGIIGQAQATANMGPVAALQAHLADPWHVNAATNAAAVPYL